MNDSDVVAIIAEQDKELQADDLEERADSKKDWKVTYAPLGTSNGSTLVKRGEKKENRVGLFIIRLWSVLHVGI